VLLNYWLNAAALDRAGMVAPATLSLEKSWTEWRLPERIKARQLSLDGPWDFQRAGWPGLDSELIPESQHWQEELPARTSAWAAPTLPWPGWYRLRDGSKETWSSSRIHKLESTLERVPAGPREIWDQAIKASGGAYISGANRAEEISRTLLSLQPGRSLSPLVWACFGLAMLVELFMLAWRGRAA
jgi:hypothetical protein